MGPGVSKVVANDESSGSESDEALDWGYESNDQRPEESIQEIRQALVRDSEYNCLDIGGQYG